MYYVNGMNVCRYAHLGQPLSVFESTLSIAPWSLWNDSGCCNLAARDTVGRAWLVRLRSARAVEMYRGRDAWNNFRAFTELPRVTGGH